MYSQVEVSVRAARADGGPRAALGRHRERAKRTAHPGRGGDARAARRSQSAGPDPVGCKQWQRSIYPSINLELLQNWQKNPRFMQFQPFRIDLGHSTLQDRGAILELQRIDGLVNRTPPMPRGKVPLPAGRGMLPRPCPSGEAFSLLVKRSQNHNHSLDDHHVKVQGEALCLRGGGGARLSGLGAACAASLDVSTGVGTLCMWIC